MIYLYDGYKITFFMLFFFGHIILLYNLYNSLQTSSDEIKDTDIEEIKEEASISITQTVQIPYEEKYLTKIREMKNEYVFTEEELILQENKLKELLSEEKGKQLENIYELNEKIEQLNIQLSDIQNDTRDEFHENKDENIRRKIYQTIENELDIHRKQLIEIQQNDINMDELKKKATQFIIDEQLKKFKKNYIIENTPLGNVLIFYNHDKLAFEYYSDLTIPYRYLDTVARKYVLTYNYRPLYIDMEEELKEYERKLQEKDKEKEENEKKQLVENTKGTKTKDVFAKFKSYNKEAGSGRVNTAPAPKNNIPQNRISSSSIIKDNKKDNTNEKFLLKENSNRYSYQGKFLNFNILQKVDRKVVDKKYALSYADFKKKRLTTN